MRYPVPELLTKIINALKEGVPDAAGQVYFPRNIPRQARSAPVIFVSYDGEQVEPQTAAPRAAHRTASIGVTAFARGGEEKAYRQLLAVREEIIAVMREIQDVPGDTESDECLVDEIRPTAATAVEVNGDGDAYYAGVKLTYEADYVTDEGSPGVAGPGVPDFNVLHDFIQARGVWSVRRGDQRVTAEDMVALPQE